MLRTISSFTWRLARRPWLGVTVCVLVCALFAAQAVGHVIEARVLPAAAIAPKVPQIAAPAPAPAPVVDRVARGASLVTRDMFCSSCAPVVTPPTPGAPGDGGIPLTSLPLVLVATSLGHEPVATLRDDRSGSQGAYVIGQELPRAGEITQIGATYVDFVNAETSREERVSLLAAAQVPAKGPDAGGAPVAADDPYADRVRKIDDTTYEVDRSLVKELVGAAGKPLPGVRMVPVAKDGKLAGVRVLSARADSIAAAVGLKSGDTLAAVNGVSIDSVDKMLEVYTKLDNLNVVAIDGTRGGKPITWQYHLK